MYWRFAWLIRASRDAVPAPSLSETDSRLEAVRRGRDNGADGSSSPQLHPHGPITRPNLLALPPQTMRSLWMLDKWLEQRRKQNEHEDFDEGKHKREDDDRG